MTQKQKDLSELTEEELIEAGFRFTGTKQDPRWTREISPGHNEFFYGMPSGRRRSSAGQTSGAVTTIVLTRRCWNGILKAYDEWGGDGRECGAAMLATREGNEIFLHETAEPYFGDVRNERAMAVKDSAGYAMEDARSHLGQVYGGFWHTHPPTSRALPSPEDQFAFGLRERKELGGTFAALIMQEREDRAGFADVKAYVSQGGKMYPAATLEVEN